jgi:predicted nucleic acid-binding protein
VILYLDTSALAKLLWREQDSGTFRAAAAQAQALASSLLAKIEVHSALARLGREGTPGSRLASSRRRFETLWASIAAVSMDRAVDAASSLCLKHPLRSLDAIHLASALLLREEGSLEIAFATADVRLRQAAQAERFQVVG